MRTALPSGDAAAHARQARLRVSKPGLTASQARVLDVVMGHAGISIKAVAAELGVSHATATFHLAGLARAGLVHAVRDGRELLHFPGRNGGASELALATLRDPAKARVVAALADPRSRHMTLNRLAVLAGTSFRFTKATLLLLRDHGLAEMQRRRYRYTFAPSGALLRAWEEMGRPGLDAPGGAGGGPFS